MLAQVNSALFAIVSALTLPMEHHVEQHQEVLLWNAKNPLGLEWQIVNDTVMGGVSRSQFFVGDTSGLFTGTLSLENNGGFASVRSVAQDLNLSSELSQLMVRVRGDGRQYKMTARRRGTYDGVNYQKEFQTKKGEWQEVELDLKEFRPRWRGRSLNEPPLRADEIRSVGIIVSDKRQGPFKLEVEWIKLTN